MRRDPNPKCVVCRRDVPVERRSGRCVDCTGVNAAPEALVSPGSPYSEDLVAQRFVEEHPDGATLEEVGHYFGVTRERVRQMEVTAIEHLKKRCQLAGISREDVAAMLMSRGRGTTGEEWASAASTGGAGYVLTNRKPPEEPLPERFESPSGVLMESAIAAAQERIDRALALVAGLEALPAEQLGRSYVRALEQMPEPVEPASTETQAPAPPPEKDEPMPKPAKIHSHEGHSLTLRQWAQRPEVIARGIDEMTLRKRMSYGWSIARALTELPSSARRVRFEDGHTERVTVADEVRSELRSVGPTDLLNRLGWPTEDLGEHPEGRLLLLKRRAG